MEDGSAANCAITGACGGGGGGGGGGGCTTGGGGGGGTFFLQAAPNIARLNAMQMIVIFLLLNMNIASSIFSYLPHTGVSLLPCVVSGCTCVPSASILQIWCDPARVDMNTRCRPSGAQLGFSFRPSPCVNCVYLRDATSMMNMLKAPWAYPRVHAYAIICPSGCQAGLEASPSPGVRRSISLPSIFIL